MTMATTARVADADGFGQTNAPPPARLKTRTTMDRGDDVRYGRRRRLAVAAASLLLALSWCGGASLRLRRRRPDADATPATTTADPASAAAPRVRRPAAIEATPDDRSGARFAGGIGRDGRRRRRRRLVDSDSDCIPFYHASILPSEPWTCTNSGTYPPEWVQGNAADYLFHLTGEACCEEMRRPWLAFGGDGGGDDAGSSAGAPACRIVDACGDAEDGAVNDVDDGGDGGDAGSNADADAHSCAGKPYWDCIKEHDCRFDGTARACVAMEAWTNDDEGDGDGDDESDGDVVVGDGCAGKRYKPCVKDPRCRFDAASDACADDAPTDDPSPVQCFGLSMKRCVKSGCQYDAYGDVCLPPSRPPQPPSAGPTGGPTDPVAYCGGRKYHPTNVVERRCSNGDAYPALWDSDPARFFFEGGEDCCATFYPGGDCEVVNVCSDAADDNGGDDGPPSPGDAYCGGKSRKHCVKDAQCDYVESSHKCVANGAYVGPPSPWDAHCEGLSKKRCAKDMRCDYVAASDACLGNGAYLPEDAETETGGRPYPATPSPATPQPMITPNPTASRPTSPSPTVEPTDAPSTPAPTYETYEPTTSFPTLSPFTPSPVMLAKDGSVIDPECYENPWHLSRAPRTKDQYCTNDRNHPEAWYHPAMRPHFLFDAPDECCRTNFGVADCDVWDVCVEGTPAPATGAPTALPTFEPWPTFAPSEVSADLSRTSEATCRNKWHVSVDPADAGNTCTNDGDYPGSWNRPSKSQYFLFDTAAGCCEGVFPDAPCELYNVCPVGGDYAADDAEPEETPAPPPRRTPTARPTRRPTGRPTRRDPWYVDRTSGMCVQDCPGVPPCGGRRPQWETPYATPDACCASMPWVAFDACLTTPSPTGPPPPTADPTERPTRSPRVRPTRVSLARVDWWWMLRMSERANVVLLFPPFSLCRFEASHIAPDHSQADQSECQTHRTFRCISPSRAFAHFPMYDETQEPTAPPTIDCSVYKWHMSTMPGEENTCSNSPEFPSNWLENANVGPPFRSRVAPHSSRVPLPHCIQLVSLFCLRRVAFSSFCTIPAISAARGCSAGWIAR